MEQLPLQLGPFLSPRPKYLPPAAILLGFLGISVGLTRSVLRRLLAGGPQQRGGGLLAASLLGIGVAAAASPLFYRETMWWFFVMYLFVIGRAIEGAITVRFFQKILYVLGERSLPGGFREKLLQFALGGTLGMMTLGAIGLLLFTNPPPEALPEALLVFTWGTFYTAMLGSVYNLRIVVARLAVSRWTSLMIASGLVLVIAGTTLYDFLPLFGIVRVPSPLLQNPTGDLAVQSVGHVGFLLGAIVAGVFYVTTARQAGAY